MEGGLEELLEGLTGGEGWTLVGSIVLGGTGVIGADGSTIGEEGSGKLAGSDGVDEFDGLAGTGGIEVSDEFKDSFVVLPGFVWFWEVVLLETVWFWLSTFVAWVYLGSSNTYIFGSFEHLDLTIPTCTFVISNMYMYCLIILPPITIVLSLAKWSTVRQYRFSLSS